MKSVKYSLYGRHIGSNVPPFDTLIADFESCTEADEGRFRAIQSGCWRNIRIEQIYFDEEVKEDTESV